MLSERALEVRHLGRVRYHEADQLQRSLLRSERDYLLFVEHPAVITAGLHGDLGHITEQGHKASTEVVSTDRGGDVTMHLPGQLVCYPIVTVPNDPGEARRHVARLEAAVIEVVQALCLSHHVDVGGVGRLEGHPGVWVGIKGDRPAKIAAVGVRVERDGDDRRRTRHGIALNVDCDLTRFNEIVPCGLTFPVTSLVERGIAVTVADVAPLLEAAMVALFAPNGGVNRAAVTASSAPRPLSDEHTPVSFRRLHQAGVDPAAGMALATRKPEWLRIPAKFGTEFVALQKQLRSSRLVTVCEEAGCPNISECWSSGTATFMVNGERCTRACGFCQVDTRHPLALDGDEPNRVAASVSAMGLEHAVVTCVARDDLADGGAGAIAATINAIRAAVPGCGVEVLISDCKGDVASLDLIFEARPDVLNHNIETVARLQRAVRPSASYARSLSVLARAADQGLVVKSGLMVGLGETDDEVRTTLIDLHAVGVSIVTIGQYLRPSRTHLPIARYAEPALFDEFAHFGRGLGLQHVQASPLTRSSYHAREAASASVPVTFTQASRGATI